MINWLIARHEITYANWELFVFLVGAYLCAQTLCKKLIKERSIGAVAEKLRTFMGYEQCSSPELSLSDAIYRMRDEGIEGQRILARLNALEQLNGISSESTGYFGPPPSRNQFGLKNHHTEPCYALRNIKHSSRIDGLVELYRLNPTSDPDFTADWGQGEVELIAVAPSKYLDEIWLEHVFNDFRKRIKEEGGCYPTSELGLTYTCEARSISSSGFNYFKPEYGDELYLLFYQVSRAALKEGHPITLRANPISDFNNNSPADREKKLRKLREIDQETLWQKIFLPVRSHALPPPPKEPINLFEAMAP